MTQDASKDRSAVLVLGIGNLLLGDEGVGVHAVRAMQELSWPERVTLMDGGTGGFHLLSCLSDWPTVIFVDATMDGREPGTVTTLQPRFANDFPRSLAAHDVGLRDLIEAATLLGGLPRMYLVTISIAEMQSGSTELSEAVGRSLSAVSEAVRVIVAEVADRAAATVAVART